MPSFIIVNPLPVIETTVPTGPEDGVTVITGPITKLSSASVALLATMYGISVAGSEGTLKVVVAEPIELVVAITA
jgi:hypothetical protein